MSLLVLTNNTSSININPPETVVLKVGLTPAGAQGIQGLTGDMGPQGIQGERGDVDIATFDVDIATGNLIMTTSLGYTGATFSINNNNLEVSL